MGQTIFKPQTIFKIQTIFKPQTISKRDTLVKNQPDHFQTGHTGSKTGQTVLKYVAIQITMHTLF